MQTNLFYDTKARGFFDSSGSPTTLTELLEGCDRANLCLIAGTFGDNREFRPLDLSGYSVELGFFREQACPQKGTWTISINGDTTDELPPAISSTALESFLNALPSVTAAGGLSVRTSDCHQGPSGSSNECPCADGGTPDKGPLAWDLCWNTTGDKPAITIDAACLWPDAVSTVNVIREGDADCTEITQIKLRERLLAYSGDADFTAKAASAINLTEVQAGGGGINAIQRVTIEPAPVGGSFCVQIGDCQSAEISVFATSAEFDDALACSDDYRVTKSGDFSWDITYLSDTAAHALLSIVCNSVVSSGGVEGTFNLATIPIQALLNGCSEIEGTVELVLTEAGDGAVCRYSEDFLVSRGQIDLTQPGSEIPGVGGGGSDPQTAINTAAIAALQADQDPDNDVETVTGTAVDNTDPRNPIVNLPAGSTHPDDDVESVTGPGVDNTDPRNPVVTVSPTQVLDHLYNSGSYNELGNDAGIVAIDASDGYSQWHNLIAQVDTFETPTNMLDGVPMFIQVLIANPNTFTFAPGYRFMGDGTPADIAAAAAGKNVWLAITKFGSVFYVSITIEQS